MRRGAKRKPMSDINVVPYIDVMLVLLIVFMVTAPMLTQGIQVELPKAVTSPIDLKDQEPLVVTIKKTGEYFVELGDTRDEALGLDAVSDMVAAILKNKPKTPVLVNGDSQVMYGTVIKLMAALQQSGVSNVGLITDSPQ
ncbi:MAG: protein TolR [Pseudomonadales bacterium]|nr:protein TolR [Pseudomonadales bacterium]